MPNRTEQFINTLEAIHSVDTHPKDKFDLLTQLAKLQKQFTESDLTELKQSKNPAVQDWLQMQS